MITAEYGHWRRVQDRDGAGGWMHYTLLSGVRTAIVEADMLESAVARPEWGDGRGPAGTGGDHPPLRMRPGLVRDLGGWI